MNFLKQIFTNIIKHTMNLKGNQLDFIIPGRWISKKQELGDNGALVAQYIDILHENKDKPGEFIFMDATLTGIERTDPDSLQSESENYLLKRYLFLTDSIPMTGGGQKSINYGNIEKASAKVATDNKPTTQQPNNTVVHKQVQEPQQTINQPIKHVEPVVENFANQLIQKILDKSIKENAMYQAKFDVHSVFDFTNLSQAISYMDVQPEEFVDYLFNNPIFLDAIKSAFLNSFINDEIVVDNSKPVEQPIPVEQPPLTIDNTEILDKLRDINNLLVFMDQKIDGVNESMTEQSTNIETVINLLEEPEFEDFEEPIHVEPEPVFEQPKPKPTVRPISQSALDYNAMVNNFKNNL